ncbi:MAG: MSMEG_0565 family glycosyltransferase [Aeromicrobium sp.]
MKIALLTYSTKPRGGVVHTLALAEALSRAGAQVDVWTLGRGGDSTFYRGVDADVGIRAVPFPEEPGEDVGARIQRSIAVLRDAFTPDDYDIVHAQDCISANAALPCLRTIHHLDTFTTPELVACHERAVVEPVGRVCVSESVAAEVKAGWGLSPTVIPNGVDAARFARAAGPEGADRRAMWRDKLGPYVLALGGIEPRKGSIDLLEAYAMMRRRRPDVRLVFAGGETLFDYRDYRAAFERRAAELGVDHEMLGVVDEDDLPALVAAAAAMAFVSTKEGFGLAAMEALAAGVPVVARDLPVLREVFGSSVRFASEPIAMAGSLASVLEDPPDPDIGRAVAASYTWEEAAAAHLAFYAGFL